MKKPDWADEAAREIGKEILTMAIMNKPLEDRYDLIAHELRSARAKGHEDVLSLVSEYSTSMVEEFRKDLEHK